MVETKRAKKATPSKRLNEGIEEIIAKNQSNGTPSVLKEQTAEEAIKAITKAEIKVFKKRATILINKNRKCDENFEEDLSLFLHLACPDHNFKRVLHRALAENDRFLLKARKLGVSGKTYLRIVTDILKTQFT